MEFDSVIVKVYPLKYNLHVVRLEKCQNFNYSLNLESGLALFILLVFRVLDTSLFIFTVVPNKTRFVERVSKSRNII